MVNLILGTLILSGFRLDNEGLIFTWNHLNARHADESMYSVIGCKVFSCACAPNPKKNKTLYFITLSELY